MNDYYEADHEDSLDTATRGYRSQRVPDGPPDEFVTEVLAALHHAEEAADQSVTVNLKEKFLAMNTTAKITIAATVLIVVGGLLPWLAPSGGTALAFTNVAEALANIRTATWNFSVETESPQGKMTINGKSMYLAPSRERREMPDHVHAANESGTAISLGSVEIFDYQKSESISLTPTTKMARVLKYENLPADGPSYSFEHLQRMVSDAQDGRVDKVENLGKRTIEGRETVGFRISKGDMECKIWTDSDTRLLVRVELTALRFKPKTRIVMSDFRINVELDESLFSLDVPEGYTIVSRLNIDAAEPKLDDLAQMLRLVAEHNDGVLPGELRNFESIYGGIIKSLIAKHGADESPEKAKAMAEFSANVERGMRFVLSLAPENDSHYAGKGVKLNTPNRPVFWYKPTPDENYQVIYADLSIKDVAAEDLDKRSLPAAVTVTEKRTVTKKSAVTKKSTVTKKAKFKVKVDSEGKITIQQD